jgi:hypothetical protein
MPMGVNGIAYGDTLMNTSAVLKRAGIKKVISLQTSTQNTNTFSPITVFVNQNGKIVSSVFCRRPTEKNPGFCIGDTFFYDDKDRVVQFQSRDATGTSFLKCETEYVGQGKLKQTWITMLPQKTLADTDIYYQYFDEKGQLIRFEKEETKFAFANASLYYHTDGFIDSIRHDDPSLGTYIFNRRQKKGNMEISLETAKQHFKWVYNQSGQCISSEWQSKNSSPGHPNTSSKNGYKSRYYYNTNGTLSKVAGKRNGKEIFSIIYSYE